MIRQPRYPLRQATGLAVLALLIACSPRPAEIALSGPTMGTTWSLRVVPPERGEDATALGELVGSTLAEVDAIMSTYRPDSAASRFNANESTDWFEVPAPLVQLVAEALRIGAVTGGAFDICVAPLVALWGFGTGQPRAEPPADAEVLAALSRSGQAQLEARLDPPALRKGFAGLNIDLDAIAPGYAVDLVARRLESRGLMNYMMEIGGEVRVHGRNAQGQRWRIGVERPEEGGRSVERVLHLEATAVSTSGDYRDFFEAGGQRYSHTIDPRTGRPVEHALASVTVLRPTATEADALATALSVLGPDAGYELAERSGWAALFILREAGGFRQRETTAFARASGSGESVP